MPIIGPSLPSGEGKPSPVDKDDRSIGSVVGRTIGKGLHKVAKGVVDLVSRAVSPHFEAPPKREKATIAQNLEQALIDGDVVKVQLYITFYPDLANGVNTRGLRPLEIAALHPNPVVRERMLGIIAKKADLQRPDSQGNTYRRWVPHHGKDYQEVLQNALKPEERVKPPENFVQRTPSAPIRSAPKAPKKSTERDRFLEARTVNLPSVLHSYHLKAPTRVQGISYDRPVASRRSGKGLNVRNPNQPLSAWMVGHSFQYIGWKTNQDITFRHDFRDRYPPTATGAAKNIEHFVRQKNSSRFYATDILVPTATGNHWVLAIVDKKEKKIVSFDSVGRHKSDPDIQKALESKAKKLGYTYVQMPTKGQQKDKVSCGVYMNLYLETYLENIDKKGFNEVYQDLARVKSNADLNPTAENQRIQAYRTEVANNIAEMKGLSNHMKTRALNKYTAKYGRAEGKKKKDEAVFRFKTEHPNGWESAWLGLYKQRIDLFDYYEKR